MQYASTRGHAAAQNFSEILLGGLAPDGGLYLPTSYPQVSGAELDAWRGLSYAGLAFEVLKKFATDIPADDLKAIVEKPIPPMSIAMRVRVKTQRRSHHCACSKTKTAAS
jgi:threonine synthase